METTSNAPTLRVLSYNVRHGQGVASLLSNARLARVISAIGPTVAGLQEVWRVGSLYDQPAQLGQLTGMTAHYHCAHTSFAGETGNLMLACATVHATELHDLGGRREMRGCLLADIETPDMRFAFAVTHLSLHTATRNLQMEMLAELLPDDRPLILVGDFNCMHQDLEPLRGLLTFAPETPPTYPSILPFRALDHLGYSAHWELDSLIALPSLASDHLPLVGELRLIG